MMKQVMEYGRDLAPRDLWKRSIDITCGHGSHRLLKLAQSMGLIVWKYKKKLIIEFNCTKAMIIIIKPAAVN